MLLLTVQEMIRMHEASSANVCEKSNVVIDIASTTEEKMVEFLATQENFDIYLDENAAAALESANGRAILKDENASAFTTSEKGLAALKDCKITNALSCKRVLELIKNDAFNQKDTFEKIELLLEKSLSDSRVPYVIQSVLTSTFTEPSADGNMSLWPSCGTSGSICELV